uniref:Uncharacterized protein n=1 Tax=Amblyomma maculatum TaxID=34609 RepID=G3MSI0_AMBMU
MKITILCICSSIMTGSVSAVHYEDDSRYFHRQRITEMLEMTELIFVKSRNFRSNSILLCHAFKKERQLRRDEYQYTMFLSPQPPQGQFVPLSTLFTTFATPPHIQENAISILSEQLHGQPSLFKLMYINVQKTCFILVRQRWRGGRECLLLQTIYSVQQLVPEDCQRIYLNQCPGQKYLIFRPECMTLLRRDRLFGS